MFAVKDLSQIDSNYFTIIDSGAYAITLRSKNTGHYWHIISQGQSRCRIYHKHNRQDEYHHQWDRRSLELTIKEIMSHDIYWLNRKKNG